MRHLKIYRAIRLIHREGSIRKAAARLSISPSALNRSIQSFEEELAFPVFERIAGGVRLSDAGELLLHVIDRHLTEFEELQRALGRLHHGETGVLRISLGADISAGLVLDCLAEFEAAFPGVSVDIRHDSTVESLRQRRVHLALLTNPVTDDMVEVVHARVCALAGYRPVAEGNPIAGVWDLADRRVLLPSEGTGSRTVISHLLRRHRLTFGVTSSLPAAEAVRQAGRAGAVAIFPEIVFGAQDEAWSGHRLAFDFGSVQVCVLRARAVQPTRAAQTFLTMLQRRFDPA